MAAKKPSKIQCTSMFLSCHQSLAQQMNYLKKKEHEKTELQDGTSEKRCYTTAKGGEKVEKSRKTVKIFVVKGSKDK